MTEATIPTLAAQAADHEAFALPPVGEAVGDRRARRRCLGCATLFVSDWCGNRLCEGCRGQIARNGVVVPVRDW